MALVRKKRKINNVATAPHILKTFIVFVEPVKIKVSPIKYATNAMIQTAIATKFHTNLKQFWAIFWEENLFSPQNKSSKIIRNRSSKMIPRNKMSL